jgi:hypothetical protein
MMLRKSSLVENRIAIQYDRSQQALLGKGKGVSLFRCASKGTNALALHFELRG